MPDTPDQRCLAGLTLPQAARVVDFVSDLHLAPELPATVAAFERYLDTSQADAVFILGDLFEVWVGDDSLAQAFEAARADSLRRACQQRPVYVMRGNRDFLLGERFFSLTGCNELSDPTLLHAFGQAVLLTHGDAWCLDDQAYQAFRAEVRSGDWQRNFLAKPLGERLAIAARMREASRAHQSEPGMAGATDVDLRLAGDWLAANHAATLVHGHTHRPGTERHPNGWTRLVLSDWDLDHASSRRAEVLRWTPQGFSRQTPSAPS